MADETEALMRVDHVKYRKAGEGKSPIGRLALFSDYVEWRDNARPEVFTWEFTRIYGQRVSQPHKSKVQLQLVLTNDEKATFVFLNPGSSQEDLLKERDGFKVKLMNALIQHGRRENERRPNLSVHNMNHDKVEDLDDYSSEDSVYVPVQSDNVGVLDRQVSDSLVKRDATIKDLETKLAEGGERESKLQKDLTERDAKIEELETKLEAAYVVAKLQFKKGEDRWVDEMVRCNTHIISISNRLDRANSTIDELTKKCTDVESANENLLDTIRIQESKIDKFQTALKEAGEEYDEMNNRMIEGEMEYERQITDYEMKIEKLETEQEKIRDQLKKKCADAESANESANEKTHKFLMVEKEKIPDPTQLYIELGKLYMELQEAKKPQEAVMAAKDKEIEWLMKQVDAKDSEIQNLKETVASLQKKMEAKDRKIDVTVMAQDSEDSEVTEKKPAKIQDPMVGKDFGFGDPKMEW